MTYAQRSHNQLVEGLVGEHFALYRNSASFHAAVDRLAYMLPLMVNGLAAEAEEADRRQETLLRLIEEAPPYPLDRAHEIFGLR